MKQLIYYHTACQTHRIFNSRYPNYHYQKLFSGDRNDSSATLPNYSLLISREQFFYQASQLWNSLPPELRNIPKIETFKKRLKLTISQTIDPFWWTRCFTSDLVISLLLCFILSSSLTATGQSPVNNSFAKWWIEIEIKINKIKVRDVILVPISLQCAVDISTTSKCLQFRNICNSEISSTKRTCYVITVRLRW